MNDTDEGHNDPPPKQKSESSKEEPAREISHDLENYPPEVLLNVAEQLEADDANGADEVYEIFEDVEADEAIGTLFSNISKNTIFSILAGILVMVVFYVAPEIFHAFFETRTGIIIEMGIGFLAGILIVLGAADLILIGVKGISDKLNWNPYIGGIISAVGAALNELVVVIILLLESRTAEDGETYATIAITLILTTVLINTLFLGIAMIFVSRKEHFILPKELTFFEANLVLGMMVFSFVIMMFGFITEFTRIDDLISGLSTSNITFSRPFEIVIGASLILIYFIFIYVLMKGEGKKSTLPQTLITEFFPEDAGFNIVEPSDEPTRSRFFPGDDSVKPARNIGVKLPEASDETSNIIQSTLYANGEKTSKDRQKARNDALATLRRFPWFIIIVVFAVGLAGIIQGGNILAHSIESGVEVFEDVPILVYAVVVGLVSSSPELIVTFRGLVSGEQEQVEVGLVHQVSAINQTFYILFGVPFVFSGIVGIGIPIALEITLVMGGIFILSTAVQIMVMDDNKFDLLEGAVITIMSIVSLLALAFIGTEAFTSESTKLATQLVNIMQLL